MWILNKFLLNEWTALLLCSVCLLHNVKRLLRALTVQGKLLDKGQLSGGLKMVSLFYNIFDVSPSLKFLGWVLFQVWLLKLDPFLCDLSTSRVVDTAGLKNQQFLGISNTSSRLHSSVLSKLEPLLMDTVLNSINSRHPWPISNKNITIINKFIIISCCHVKNDIPE